MKIQNKTRSLANLGLDILSLALILLLLQSVFLPNNAEAASRNNSFLAKSASAPTVYFVSGNNYKLAIPSAKVFFSYGYKWSQVKTVSDNELAGYPDSKYISENSSAAIYFLNGTGKRYVTQAAASVLAIKPEEVISVNRTEFRGYKTENVLDDAEAGQMVAAETTSNNTDQTAEACVPDPNAGGADGCAIYDASVKNDPSLCAQISNPDYLPSCYAMFDAPTGTPVTFYCNQLSNANLNELCIGKVAVRKKDASLCDLIQTTNNKNQCQAAVGMATGDLDKCSLLPAYSSASPNAPSQDTCVYTYAVLNSNTTVCSKIPKTSPFYDACLKFAQASQTAQ